MAALLLLWSLKGREDRHGFGIHILNVMIYLLVN